MSCVLCDSWAHCPVNPESLHPRKRTEITDQDVETALLTGFVWGKATKQTLCDDHALMVANMMIALRIT